MRLYRYRVKQGRLTVESARGFISDKARRGKMAESVLWKAGLNWYFRQAKALPPLPDGVPSLGRADLGKSDWERRLIERLGWMTQSRWDW